MTIDPTSQLSSMAFSASPISERTPTTTATLGKVVQGFVADTNAQQLQADKSVELLATGQSDSVHETMLALTKADLSLRVFMEVRNKVIDAYQDVMRMQF